MKLPKFRNAIVYRATLPSIQAIEGHLLELPYSEIGETEFSRSSFVENPVTGWICPYISRHLLSLNPLLACCRRYSRGER